MASIRKVPSGAYQLQLKNKLLPKTLWARFDTYEAAEQYGRQLGGLLAQGIVPTALLERAQPKQEIWTANRCVVEYMRANPVPTSDVKLFDTMRSSLAVFSTSGLNYDWAEAWVRSMKRDLHLAPSTIRHRHGALARCFDWMCRKHPEIMAQNPLRLLKRGFATYTVDDAQALAAKSLTPREDVERNRSLLPEEERAVLEVLAERPIDRVFFVAALETAMRMRELYTLTVEQVSIPKKTIHLDRSKNGDNRQVPLSSTACSMLATYMLANATEIRSREGRFFPFWEGSRDTKALDKTTVAVSVRFARIFDEAKLVDFTFHDLQHEATCRLYEKTRLSDVLISRITGHRDIRMLKRYASLRGSDLAVHLW